MLLQGIFPAITTPFYRDGKLYLKKLEHNVDRYSRTPVSGIVVLGSTGEAVMLSDDEQRQVLKLAREVAAEEKVLVAGVGQESADLTLSLAEQAAHLGYDVALVRTPSYYRPQMKNHPQAIVSYYRFVADRSPLPVLLYSVPAFTAYDLPVEAVAELAQHPNIIGLKESSGNAEKIAAISAVTGQVKRTVNVTEIFHAVTGRMLASISAPAPLAGIVPSGALASAAGATVLAPAAVPAPRPRFRLRTKEVGFQILAGSAQTLLSCLQAGATGAVLAFAAPAPTACFELYTAWKENDEELARIKQQRIAAAATRVASNLGIPGVKYALDLNGYYGGPARLPLLPLTAAEKQEVEDLLRDIRN